MMKKKRWRRRRKKKEMSEKKKCCCRYHTTGEFIGLGDILLKMKFSFHTRLFIHYFFFVRLCDAQYSELWFWAHQACKQCAFSVQNTIFLVLDLFHLLFLCSKYFPLILVQLWKNHINNVSPRKWEDDDDTFYGKKWIRSVHLWIKGVLPNYFAPFMSQPCPNITRYIWINRLCGVWFLIVI